MTSKAEIKSSVNAQGRHIQNQATRKTCASSWPARRRRHRAARHRLYCRKHRRARSTSEYTFQQPDSLQFRPGGGGSPLRPRGDSPETGPPHGGRSRRTGAGSGPRAWPPDRPGPGSPPAPEGRIPRGRPAAAPASPAGKQQQAPGAAGAKDPELNAPPGQLPAVCQKGGGGADLGTAPGNQVGGFDAGQGGSPVVGQGALQLLHDKVQRGTSFSR